MRTRFAKAFAQKRDGAAVVAYLMAGDPDTDRSVEYALALVEGGAAAIEVGMPFSDPIADGPVIQRAAVRALAGGTTPKVTFDVVKRVRNETDVPIAIMTYYNLLYRRGLASFVDDAKAAGVDGLIIPDLPVEEAQPLMDAARPADVDTVFLASPATDDARLKRIVDATRGFLYVVSSYGVTGAAGAVNDRTMALVKRFKPFTEGKVPLAVGFGVSERKHVEALGSAGADAVVVGSAIVRRIEEGAKADDIAAFVRGLVP